jgi:hypothetical protein
VTAPAATAAAVALAFSFDRASARVGTTVAASQPGWNGAPDGVVAYLVPTRIPGVHPDQAGSYLLPAPPERGVVRLGKPRLTPSHRLAIRFRVPRVAPGDYTIAFWCATCAPGGDFFASAPWGARWTGAAGLVLRVRR